MTFCSHFQCIFKHNACFNIIIDNKHDLTHLPLVPHFASVNQVSIGPDNGLVPIRCRAIISRNAGILSIGHQGANLSDNWIGILMFSFKKMRLKMSSAKAAATVSRGRWVKNWPVFVLLTHWGRVTHICVSNLTIIVSDNGLSPGRRQAIILYCLLDPFVTYFSEILVEIHTFWLKKMTFKMPSGKWRPFCFGLNVLTVV